MSINKKIVGLILLGFLLVATVSTFSSVNSLKKSQAENLRLFKAEFLELARESFENNSYQFFHNLDSAINFNDSKEAGRENILGFIEKSNYNGNTLVFNIDDRSFLRDYTNNSLLNIYDKNSV